MPILRQVCTTTGVDKTPMDWRIFHSASHFQVVFVAHSFWYSDCFFQPWMQCDGIARSC